jgi:hypothetical protein
MKKNRWLLRLAVLLVVSAALNVTFSAAAEAGSSGDPLVTLSYLNDTYLPALMSKVDSRITDRNAAVNASVDAKIAAAGLSGGAASSGTAETFTVVTLSKGQTLKGGIGCEVMLRVGTAACVAASAPGLVDETAGSTIAGGSALTVNHLYMMTIEDRGVKATAATVKLMVRGSYTVA